MLLSNATYLENESINIDNISFYFCPFQPWFYDWAFNFPKDPTEYEEKATKIWQAIPDDVNILITHGPAYGILDKVENSRKNEDPHVGCKYLLERINELKELKIHAFGHIHSEYSVIQLENYIAINASNLNEQYEVTNEPIVLDI